MAVEWKKIAYEDNVIAKSLFDADTFLYATNDNTPVATSPANVMAALSGHAAAEFSFNSQNLIGVGSVTLPNAGWAGIGAALERLEFYTAGYAAFMGCYLGIGTNTPAEKLELKGKMRQTSETIHHVTKDVINTQSVSTTAVEIYDQTSTWGTFALVVGSDALANRFLDILSYTPNAAVNVINSGTTRGAPVARTYSIISENLCLKMASDSYDITVYGIDFSSVL